MHYTWYGKSELVSNPNYSSQEEFDLSSASRMLYSRYIRDEILQIIRQPTLRDITKVQAISDWYNIRFERDPKICAANAFEQLNVSYSYSFNFRQPLFPIHMPAL